MFKLRLKSIAARLTTTKTRGQLKTLGLCFLSFFIGYTYVYVSQFDLTPLGGSGDKPILGSIYNIAIDHLWIFVALAIFIGIGLHNTKYRPCRIMGGIFIIFMSITACLLCFYFSNALLNLHENTTYIIRRDFLLLLFGTIGAGLGINLLAQSISESTSDLILRRDSRKEAEAYLEFLKGKVSDAKAKQRVLQYKKR